jgi:hypothetical protein
LYAVGASGGVPIVMQGAKVLVDAIVADRNEV